MYVFFEIPKGELPPSKQLVMELLRSEISPQFPLANASDAGNFPLTYHVASDKSFTSAGHLSLPGQYCLLTRIHYTYLARLFLAFD